jgi:hypothetical protein
MKNIIITLSNEHTKDLESISQSMSKDGLRITRLFEFGVIAGSANEETIEKLKKYKEVYAIGYDGEMRIISKTK